MAIGFQNAVDIANRGLMHVGQIRIDPNLGFAEDSKQASACAFVYDKLRRAELQRKTWTFATRRAILRPISRYTMFLTPALWSASVYYAVGSVVSDQAGYLWQSNAPDNFNNTPGNSSLWDTYFGPLSVDPWDNTGKTTYFAGELVFILTTTGFYSVFVSLRNDNADNPEVPRQWDANQTYVKDQVVQFAPAWSSLTTYTAGQLVTFTDGNTYASLVSSNLNNTPTGSKWAAVPTPYFLVAGNPPTEPPGPIQPTTFLEWNATITYTAGQFVDVSGTQYVALTSTTNNAPASSPSQWAALTNATLYQSLIDLNFDNNPSSSPILWSALTSYSVGNQVCGSDGVIYTSVINSNLGNQPVGDNGTHWTNTGSMCPWTTTGLVSQGLVGSGSSKWRVINNAVLAEQTFVYPVGSGPIEEHTTRNVFRLPANFLRKCPEDPKSGAVSWLGTPRARVADDWVFEDPFLISWCPSPIPLRFVADFTDVTRMHDLFCEGLGARIGYEICEEVTQSSAKKSDCATAYTKFMGEARMVNAIEQGPVEPPQDDLIACRW